MTTNNSLVVASMMPHYMELLKYSYQTAPG